MQSPAVFDRLRATWDWFDERCRAYQGFTGEVYASYSALWRRGWRWWAPALVLAPLVCVALILMVALLLLARLLSVTVAAAPLLIVVWAVMSFAVADSGTSRAVRRSVRPV